LSEGEQKACDTKANCRPIMSSQVYVDKCIWWFVELELSQEAQFDAVYCNPEQLDGRSESEWGRLPIRDVGICIGFRAVYGVEDVEYGVQ
jgi:hypothetical protein